MRGISQCFTPFVISGSEKPTELMNERVRRYENPNPRQLGEVPSQDSGFMSSNRFDAASGTKVPDPRCPCLSLLCKRHHKLSHFFTSFGKGRASRLTGNVPAMNPSSVALSPMSCNLHQLLWHPGLSHTTSRIGLWIPFKMACGAFLT